MEITEVSIKLVEQSAERLMAFCSITFDSCFVVRDLKLIDGPTGPFVAMPSRKIMVRCPRCQSKNPVRASFCNQCGTPLFESEPARDETGRAKLYADIAHPINAQCRDMIQQAVVEAYKKEVILAQQPGYICRYDDCDENVADGPHFNRQPARHENRNNNNRYAENRSYDNRRNDNRYENPNKVSRRTDRRESVPSSHLDRIPNRQLVTVNPTRQQQNDDDFGSGIF